MKTFFIAGTVAAFFTAAVMASDANIDHSKYSVANIGWQDCADIRQDHCNN